MGCLVYVIPGSGVEQRWRHWHGEIGLVFAQRRLRWGGGTHVGTGRETEDPSRGVGRCVAVQFELGFPFTSQYASFQRSLCRLKQDLCAVNQRSLEYWIRTLKAILTIATAASLDTA